MTKQEKLLNKYYSGKTTLEEEKELKDITREDGIQSAEQDIFGYFENESRMPKGLEKELFSNLETNRNRGRTIRLRLLSFASAAAVILILLSLYINFRNTRIEKMENDFFVMENALFQVSESLQPEEQEEMLVLWVDDNVEIIIN